MSNNIYKIVDLGLYCIGHFRATEIRILIGNPQPCGHIVLSQQQMMELLGVLRIDWEDGDYLHNYLKEQFVTIECDEDGKFALIGDPFGNNFIDLRENSKRA